VGAGRSQEATFELLDDIQSGTWTLVADGLVSGPVTVTFDILVRRNGQDVMLAEWTKQLDKLPGGYTAQPIDLTAPSNGYDAKAGDLLIFRYRGEGGTMMAYSPNGDGERTNGRIPFLVLP
jgi:hypothetical protein